MKSILSKHKFLQSEYSKLSHYSLPDPSKMEGMTVDKVYNYIRDMQFFLNEEINELLIELGGGDRAIHKPWSVRYNKIRENKFETNDGVKNEAIDAMCFMMNIILASGVNPESIEDQYEIVYQKNRSRQNNDSY